MRPILRWPCADEFRGASRQAFCSWAAQAFRAWSQGIGGERLEAFAGDSGEGFGS